ncbi:MAG: ATP-binding protein, partial [Planctomycetota bacterium]
RVVEISRNRRTDIAEVEREIIGIDHRAAGKRLAERWGLPFAVQDAMWLCAHPPAHLPDVPHRPLIRVIIAASELVRSMHIGFSGRYSPTTDFRQLCIDCGLEPFDVDRTSIELQQRLEARAAALGLHSEHDPSLLLSAIGEANSELGRLHEMMRRRSTGADAAQRSLREIGAFHEAVRSSSGLGRTLEALAQSGQRLLGGRVPCILWQRRAEESIELHTFDATGRPTGASRCSGDLVGLAESFDGGQGIEAGAVPLMTLIGDELPDGYDAERLRLLSMRVPPGSAAALLHEPSETDLPLDRAALAGVTAAWSGAIAAAAQHDGARHMAEQLASANAALSEAHAELVEASSHRRLAELAAGAAHEMNNPLTVISGNAQVLGIRLRNTEEAPLVRTMVQASERLSDLISGLHFFANPPRPQRRRTNLPQLIMRAISQAGRRARQEARNIKGLVVSDSPIVPIFDARIPPASIDPDHVRLAVTELVLNAIQSRPRSRIEVRVHIDPRDDRLSIAVTDDGIGMSSRTLEHAFDPFFSDKEAGRRTGLGLAKARRLVDMHGGTLELTSTPGEGTQARIVLDAWRWTVGDTETALAA